jgi:LAGLIDADG endonuclease
MFVWRNVDSELDGGFAAGLIAGDGHFAIQPNNGGTSWQCFLAVRLRADDTPLLADLCRWSGAGKLYAVPARRTSRPQTNWIVQRKADCRRIVSILDRHRLLGKKQGQFAIWRRAIAAWTGMGGDRHTVVAACSEQLRAHRHFDVVPGASVVAITDHELCAFLAGFVTAEAHFGATSEGHPHFRINLRNDDGELLNLLCDRIGLGRLADVPPYRTSKAALSWQVARLDELRALTLILDRYPPRGRVLRIYEAWRELVLLEDRKSGRRRSLAARVRERRAYTPGLEWIETVKAVELRRRRHIAVLQDWAAHTDGRLTATAYEAWRRWSRPEAPKRETIAAAFGSWIEALEAAGLSTQGCRAPALNAKAQAKAAASRPVRKAGQRAAILAALRDCTRMLERQPGITEFMAWRSRHAPDAPSQATVYRAFPDGWASVLEALAAETGSLDVDEPLQPLVQPLHVPAPPREDLAREPHVQAGSVDQVGHERVAGHEVAAWQRQ